MTERDFRRMRATAEQEYWHDTAYLLMVMAATGVVFAVLVLW